MRALKSALKVIDRSLAVVEHAVVIVCGSALLVVLMYSAIGRYLAGYGAPEETELTWLFFKWLCFFGASSIARTGDHPSLGLISDRVAEKGFKGKVYVAVLKAIGIVFAASIIYGIYRIYPIISIGRTAMLRLPLTYYYAAALIGMSFLIARYVIKILQNFMR